MPRNEISLVNESAITEFEQGGNNPYAPKSVGAELVTSREAQEVQVAMVAAKRFPRDEMAAYNRIISDCQRVTLAEKAIYSFPRGRETVTGPSIHLAKAMARSWGNLDTGFKVLDQNAKESVVMAYCWDLETNYRQSKVFTVKNVRQTKAGSYELTDPRDVYENIANQAARRERSCILGVIPADIVEAATAECRNTLKKQEGGKGGMNTVDMVRYIFKMFADKYGVTQRMLEDYVGVAASEMTTKHVTDLKGVYNAIKDGEASVEDFFGEQEAPETPAEKNPEPVKQPEAPKQPESVNLDDL